MQPETRPCAPDARYGHHDKAHAFVQSFAAQVDAILKEAEAAANGEVFDMATDGLVAAKVADVLAPLLATPDLLCDELQASSTEKYRKHVLSADPDAAGIDCPERATVHGLGAAEALKAGCGPALCRSLRPACGLGGVRESVMERTLGLA